MEINGLHGRKGEYTRTHARTVPAQSLQTGTILTHGSSIVVVFVAAVDEVTIAAAFDKFDADGSGQIDVAELSALAEDLGFPFESERELKAALKVSPHIVSPVAQAHSRPHVHWVPVLM